MRQPSVPRAWETPNILQYKAFKASWRRGVIVLNWVWAEPVIGLYRLDWCEVNDR